MPSRNVLKIDIADSYYHVYARGASKKNIFITDEDYKFFIRLFRRYLSQEEMKNSAGLPYKKLYDELELLCYCLMNNHFHLLLYQIEEGSMQRFMRGVMTGYSRYFNTKYGHSGSLFESRYKASRVGDQIYLEHITRYIHLNPKEWETYPYSSIKYYITDEETDWLDNQKVIELFESRLKYEEFVSDYASTNLDLDSIKYELADS